MLVYLWRPAQVSGKHLGGDKTLCQQVKSLGREEDSRRFDDAARQVFCLRMMGSSKWT